MRINDRWIRSDLIYGDGDVRGGAVDPKPRRVAGTDSAFSPCCRPARGASRLQSGSSAGCRCASISIHAEFAEGIKQSGGAR